LNNMEDPSFNRSGPLVGIRVLELPAIGPVPFAGALLADMGADVVRLDRTQGVDLGTSVPPSYDFYNRNKRSVAVDLKNPDGVSIVLSLLGNFDILLEGFRPGVAERLGLGPEECLKVNPRLVYGRMTGWGQEGPNAQDVGHDINYLALTGALHCIGGKGQPPVTPLNLVADLGGGAMYLAFGALAALTESRQSGRGQVLDVGMLDGVSNLMSAFLAYRQLGTWSLERQSNIVDGGAPYYGTYETSDGKFIAVGAIESRFYASLVERLGLNLQTLPPQNEQTSWPAMRERFAEVFKTRSRDEWVQHMAGHDACFSPVLDIDEAQQHPQMKARKIFTEFQGLVHPAPTPRFSRTPGSLYMEPPQAGQHSREVLAEFGLNNDELDRLENTGVIRQVDLN
jgi:alpha-methylacyl-CoA racemase